MFNVMGRAVARGSRVVGRAMARGSLALGLGLVQVGQGALELGRGLQDLFFPVCRGCGLCGGVVDSPAAVPGAAAGQPGLCRACLTACPFPRGLPLCSNCSRPLDGPWVVCPDCAAGSNLSGVAAVGLYQPPLSRGIVRLKYYGQRQLATGLGALLEAAVVQRWPGLPFAAVVPVPLHPRRLRERGYNQSELLARALCLNHSLPLCTDWLERIQQSAAQAKLDRIRRQQNAEAAFAARGVPAGAHLLLVDDVLTTGATARAAAGALLAAGAGRVSVAVLAVSPRLVW